MGKWRIWHSARSFADFIVANTMLSQFGELEFKELRESDASKGGSFHQVPDHIKKILYLDAADVIIEYKNNPILCIEETKEAGTGHNAFQRFARIAAAVENNVPAIYIMPEAVIIKRKDEKARWDAINPMVFKAYSKVISIFDIPALFFFYPSDYQVFRNNPENSPHYQDKGIIYNDDIVNFPACPTEKDPEMQTLFKVINTIVAAAKEENPVKTLIREDLIEERTDWLSQQFYKKLADRKIEDLSPITATVTVETRLLTNYLKQYASPKSDNVSELLSSRKETVIYQCDSLFRGDPYAGTLSALDYLLCRRGRTYEDRKKNLVLCFGKVIIGDDGSISVNSSKCSIDDFIQTVERSGSKNLLTTHRFSDLKSEDIGRYYMQVRYGSTYSKVKHIRVFSYFADAIIFADGALWREA